MSHPHGFSVPSPWPAIFLLACLLAAQACGPVPRPKNAYTSGPDLLADFQEQRGAVRGLRISGRVDHRGEGGFVRGKIYLFAALPDHLRIELVSPFNTPLSVFVVDPGGFKVHLLSQGRYLDGEASPCNIAKFIHVPLPPADIMKILAGHTPVIAGEPRVTWDRNPWIWQMHWLMLEIVIMNLVILRKPLNFYLKDITWPEIKDLSVLKRMQHSI